MSDDEPVARALAALGETPRRLAALSRYSESRWRMQPADGGWSALEVLAHLRSSDAIIAPRLFQVVLRDEPLLLDWDERRWQEVAAYTDTPAARLVAAFLLRREELLHALERLPPAGWLRIGRHERRGPLTLLQLAEQLSGHEREHLEQLERALAEPG